MVQFCLVPGCYFSVGPSSLVRALERVPHLRHLDVSNTAFTDDMLREVSPPASTSSQPFRFWVIDFIVRCRLAMHVHSSSAVLNDATSAV